MADALREVFAEFGIEFDDAQLQKGAQSVQGVIAGVRQLAQVIAGNAIVGAIREFANAFEEQAGRLEDTAGALGTTTRALQEMRFAAVSAGLSTEQADGALQRFQQTVADAAATIRDRKTACRPRLAAPRHRPGRERRASRPWKSRGRRCARGSSP